MKITGQSEYTRVRLWTDLQRNRSEKPFSTVVESVKMYAHQL